MLKLCTLASGSDGNCTYISGGKTNILIDAGISARRIATELSMVNTGISGIEAVFVTHEHGDHICGLEKLFARTNVKIYASPGTVRGISERVPALAEQLFAIEPKKTMRLGELEISSFHTSHDTYESVGYRICSEKHSAVVVTDIGCMQDGVLENICGADILLLEANYDKNRIKYSKYPEFLKARIKGNRGHLSNDECACVVLEAVKKGTKSIVLGHLSAENNTPTDAYTAVHSMLTQNGIIPGVDVFLTVAPRGKRGTLLTVGE